MSNKCSGEFVSEASFFDLKVFSILTIIPFGCIFLMSFVQKASGEKQELLGLSLIHI